MAVITTESISRLATSSAWSFLGLAARRKLHRVHEYSGKSFRIENAGTFSVFRDTRSEVARAEPPVVLVVGFRLKVIRSVPLAHWLFQRVCLLTTPFWSGMAGFKEKLWMVDPETKNYLGIYDWRGEEEAQRYVDALVRVLKPLSTSESVWYRLYPDQRLEPFLRERLMV